ncbi:hypothetical protein SCHPADRAFT_615116 [Schizopora paradoxa]|uniref:Uncharacterized protein n=1 Tax=Schizopora paradoxa TaxID=27342 RepID=A0A0H2RFB5_9AGAM|nr:hypothetical protein SCHPADRAFT_615116 [Schizopora paradoxa]
MVEMDGLKPEEAIVILSGSKSVKSKLTFASLGRHRPRVHHRPSSFFEFLSGSHRTTSPFQGVKLTINPFRDDQDIIDQDSMARFDEAKRLGDEMGAGHSAIDV